MKIIFGTSKNDIDSKTIRVFTKRWHKVDGFINTHCMPVVNEDSSISLTVASADLPRVVIKEFKPKDDYQYRIYYIPDRKNKNTYIDYFKAVVVGKRYGILDLLWHAWRYFYLHKIIFKTNPIKTGLECMQVAAIFLICAGYEDVMQGIDHNSINAAEMENIVLKIKGVKLIETKE